MAARLSVAVVGGAMACLAGCGDLFHDTSWAEGTTSAGSGGASSSSASTASGGSGAGGGATGCPEGASPLDEACAIDEARGVFVRNEGRAGATGTRSDPFASIDEAVAAAGGRAVFLCAQTFAGPLELPAGSWLVGGLTCDQDGWPLGGAGTRSRVEAPADAIPLRASAGEGETRLERLEVVAADATLLGSSSIALLATGVSLALRDCALEAGQGADGRAGLPSGDIQASDDGDPGQTACVGAGVGGPGGQRTCTGGATHGGEGGDGGNSTPAPGQGGGDGLPARGAGAGGDGQPLGTGWTCTDEGNGDDGDDGDDGAPGAPADGLGFLLASGFVPDAGQAGTPGAPGRGGGGGGGGRGVASGTCAFGAAGGGGGAGGCGGQGGTPGRGGGGSFALAAVDAAVRIEGGSLTAARGGAGGDGGVGGLGVVGGAGAPGGAGNPGQGAAQGCSGGDGGRGGDGGAGGAGRGGHAAGVAFVGAAPELDASVTIVLPEASGPGGETPDGAAAEDGELEELLAIP